MEFPGRTRAVTIPLFVLWIVALGVTAWFAYLRWRTTARAPIGADFGYSLAAARDIAAGRSPYLVKQYVYPPPLALLLAPFAHADQVTVWKAWSAVVIGAPIVGVLAVVNLIRGRSGWWLRPLAFGLFSFTILYSRYYPLSRDLDLGQSDTVLVSLIAISAVLAIRFAPGRGIMLGVAGLIKVWPWASVVSVAQSGAVRRSTVLLYTGAVALLAPLTALIFGWSGLVGFVQNDFDKRQQTLVSDCVWSIPRLLFSRTGLARPIVTSGSLEVALTALLAVWVIVLLVMALRTPGDVALCTWNVTFCVILLLPVSHRQYAMVVLPLLWWWTVRLLDRRVRTWYVLAVAGVMLLWWINQTVAWPYNGDSNTITSLRYSVPFLGDLIACTASVIGAAAMSNNPATGRRSDRLFAATMRRARTLKRAELPEPTN